MRNRTKWVVFLLAAVAGSASAHHSFAAFDLQKTVEIEGVLKEVRFSNPHSWFVVAVAGANGASEEWAVEGLSPAAMVSKGIKRSAFKVGDHVQVKLNPMRAGGLGGSLVSVKLDDGTVVTGGPGQ